jgi:hypothetical protein
LQDVFHLTIGKYTMKARLYAISLTFSQKVQ